MNTLSLDKLCMLAAATLVAVSFVTTLGCTRPPDAQRKEAVPTLVVATPVSKQIVEWDAYTGRMEAVDFVEVRARVDGYLQSMHFEEGQMVEKGDLLFVIDPRPFTAELNRAQAALRQAQSQVLQAQAGINVATAKKAQTEAQLKLAQTRIERTRSLQRQNAVSQDELEQRESEQMQAVADVQASEAGIKSAEATLATAKASVESAQAGVEAAELNLEYTQVTAPITGRISNRGVSVGNLITGTTANSTMLTTIASVAPIYCRFDANEQEVLKYMRLDQTGQRQSSRDTKNPVFLGLSDEEKFPHRGHIDFVDNRFDEATASMRARAVFPNEDRSLVPGMFARIRIPGSAPYQAVLIPDSALGVDQSSQYVYVVVDGHVERRAVETGPIVDQLRVIRKGLDGTEALVIEGLLHARPGMIVQVQTGQIKEIEDGLPDDYRSDPRLGTANDQSAKGLTANPTDDTTNPSSGAGVPTDGADNPTTGTTNAASGTTNPTIGTTNAASGTTNAASGTTNAASGTTNPVGEATKPMIDTDNPSAEATKPTGDAGTTSGSATAITSDNSPQPTVSPKREGSTTGVQR